ncbi:hypothetical protein HWV62_11223 [Athelia sp. TMB]|nr:hypothetical protein HWV62_11223 [Athelia sp. TMB]
MAFTGAFTANGLLRSNAMGFSSNGLLGGSITTKDQVSTLDNCGEELDEDAMLLDEGFSPNRLLEGAKASGTFRISPVQVLSERAYAETQETTATFSANGLLSESRERPPVSVADTYPEDPSSSTPLAGEVPVPSASHSTFSLRSSIRATTYDGKPLFMKRRTRVDGLRNKPNNASSNRMANLLDIPIHRLMDELSAATAAKIARPDLQAKATSNLKRLPTEDTLWVDRYRPQRFSDLLGNDRVARETMAWVKQWDFCVFGSKKGKKRPRDDDDNFNSEDDYHRPREKLLLISGPPGLGKTTMAHIIARQAGYQVMEINASDARSAQVVDDRIRPALESGSAIGSSKPVLIVIDEIDGATGGGDNSGGFVQRLVQLTYDKPKDKGRMGAKKDNKGKRPLLRPIICICNDQNAHSLAKLRPHARQIRFSRPADLLIVKRLREICAAEELKADSRALSTLVGVARGDLRGCLNALQFIKARSGEVTEPIIRAATAGMKEAEASNVTVLNNLFAPMTRKRVKELGLGEKDEAKYVARLSREIDSNSNPGAVATGCFAHYPNLRRHDATFSRYEKANDWLVAFDTFSATMYSDGDFGLHSYLSYLLERGGQRIERDSADWEHFQLSKSNEEIYKTLSQGMRTACARQSGDYRHLLGGQIMKLEFASYINRIISPPLRPVNSQVVRPEERELMSRLVGIMVALDLRFVQEKAEDGQLVYRLDPPIDVFVTYDGKRASDIAISRYAVRHMVAAEIDAAWISRQADVVEKNKGAKLDMFSKTSKMVSKYDKGSDTEEHESKRSRQDHTDIADKVTFYHTPSEQLR